MKHDRQSCSIKYVNANRGEEFITTKLSSTVKNKLSELEQEKKILEFWSGRGEVI